MLRTKSRKGRQAMMDGLMRIAWTLIRTITNPQSLSPHFHLVMSISKLIIIFSIGVYQLMAVSNLLVHSSRISNSNKGIPMPSFIYIDNNSAKYFLLYYSKIYNIEMIIISNLHYQCH